jgi:hypothetical protein
MKDYLEQAYSIINVSLDRHLFVLKNYSELNNGKEESKILTSYSKSNDLRESLKQTKLCIKKKTFKPQLNKFYVLILYVLFKLI